MPSVQTFMHMLLMLVMLQLPLPTLFESSLAAASRESSPATGLVFAPVGQSDGRRAVMKPLAEDTYKFQFTASRACHEKLRQAQALLRHRIPDGDVGTIVERTLGAARSPTSLVAGVPRRAPSNSITWTVLRERTSTVQRTDGCCAEPITSTPPNRCTVARSWSEPADRPRPLQLFPGFLQDEPAGPV